MAYREENSGSTTMVPERYDRAPRLHDWVLLQKRQMKLWREGRSALASSLMTTPTSMIDLTVESEDERVLKMRRASE